VEKAEAATAEVVSEAVNVAVEAMAGEGVEAVDLVGLLGGEMGPVVEQLGRGEAAQVAVERAAARLERAAW
jgi:hypothetical protein